MKWLSALALCIVSLFASTVEESIALTTIDVAGDIPTSVGEALVPVMFQNGFHKLLKRGASGVICDGQYKYVISSDTDYMTTRDYFSQMGVTSKALIYSTDDMSAPKYRIEYKGQYVNVLISFEERSQAQEQNFDLKSAKLSVKEA